MTGDRPAVVQEEHLLYLDRLRASGSTNMFGAPPYLTKVFGLSKADAIVVLSYWMETFSERHEETR